MLESSFPPGEGGGLRSSFRESVFPGTVRSVRAFGAGKGGCGAALARPR
jgi:hypothetical protein